MAPIQTAGVQVTDRDMMNKRVRTTPTIDGFTVPIPVEFDKGGGRKAKDQVKLIISREGGGVFLSLRL